MKNILIYGLGLIYGGIENVVISFINNVRNLNYLHFTIVLNDGYCKWEDKIINQNVDYLRIVPWGRNPFRHGQMILKMVSENNFDIIWINVASLTTLTFIQRLRKYSHSKILIHAHGSNIESQSKIKGFISRMMHGFIKMKVKDHAYELIACSEKAGEWMFGKQKYSIIYNGIDISKFRYNNNVRERYRQEMDLGNDDVYLMVGRLSKVKNQLFGLDVFNHIINKNPHSKLLIVGVGELKDELTKFVILNNIQNKVKFLGFREDVNNLYNASDVYLFPSLHEGFPLVLIEAQCSGIECFISDSITDESCVTNLVKKIRLGEISEVWANEILNRVKEKREDQSIKIKENRMDIDSMCMSILQHM